MNRDAIRTVLLEELHALAPEADLAALPPAADLRERLEIDSFSLLTLMVALEKRLGVSVPERDYRRLTTLAGAVEYLAAKLGETGAPASR